MDELEILERLQHVPDLLLAAAQVKPGRELTEQTRLRGQYDGELVRSAFQLVEMRRRARMKFSRAESLWLDRTGYEQATTELVAQHKAQRFAAAGSSVIDLCCGIGADAIALAQAGLQVIAVDRSPSAIWRTQQNARVYDVAEKIETRSADVREVDVTGQLVHFDPDRRQVPSGRRARQLEEYEPGPDFMRQVISTARGGAIKLSPASNFGSEFRDCEVELVSLDRECREAIVWFGDLAQSQPRRATVLPSGESLTGHPGEHRPRVGELGRYIYDPDPALVRAGLLDLLTEHLPLRRLDDAEEYLTSDDWVSSPFVSGFEVRESLPHNETQIRNYYREHPAGDLEIKSRHVPTNESALRKKIPLAGTGRTTLLIARLQGKTRAIAAQRVVES